MPTILLADDNADSRDIYHTMFAHAGYQVLEAGDGDEALKVVRSGQPDVVLLNLRMPGTDGNTVLKRLRSLPETRELPCLVFTGDARLEQMGTAMMNGADAFLTKPAEPREVLRFVEELLSGAAN